MGAAYATIAVTLATGMSPERFRAEVPWVLPGALIILVFGILVGRGHRWLTRALSVLAGCRTALFLLNGFGINPHLDVSSPAIAVHRTGSLEPVFLINALLVGCATALLVRAGWDL